MQSNTLYSVSPTYFLGATTAFDIFVTDNAEELLTCGFQYPSLPISILHLLPEFLDVSDITLLY